MFATVLVANRGEIAVRVLRTLRRLGVRGVAVHTDADAGAPHVVAADVAVRIGSYLSIDDVLDAARATGAEAIHPGYGFLAENTAFAAACTAAGIAFVGPPASAIEAMGDKIRAKQTVAKAGVPVVPGSDGAGLSDAELVAAVAEIGYPVLLKPSAGGGGKGMHEVHRPEDLEAAIATARREARSSFGDDTLLVERLVTSPRHIEIQVLADAHGNAVHLGERECSLQRRHQKIVEEAPSPLLTPEQRAAMGAAAVEAAKSVGYTGAGTVEFIVGADRPDEFFFMEMNTRLQVEHPVTEMITGQDLVEWQLRVAGGEELPLRQEQLTISGHAVEARVYAEDPVRNFLPSVGVLHRLRSPAENAHVRVDTGVSEGDAVTPYYDPMIAKLIVWDTDRKSALRRLRQALGEYQIAGVATNTAFLIALAGHPAFVEGDLDTGFIERFRSDLIPQQTPAPVSVLALAALAVTLERRAQAAAMSVGDPWSPWSAVNGWRMNDVGWDELIFKDRDTDIACRIEYVGADAVRLRVQDKEVLVQGTLEADGTLDAALDGRRMKIGIVRQGDDLTILLPGETHKLTLVDPRVVSAIDEGAGGQLNAPMPGKVVQVLVAEGAKVEKGQALMILEAMKMEHTISAPGRGVVAKINFQAGDQVTEGVSLLSIEGED